MKERLNAWWARRPRPRRGHRLALNLVLCAGLLSLLWGMAGYPLPTAEMEFRRLERSSLEERSELMLSLDEGAKARDGTEFSFTRSMVIGETEGRILVGYANGAGGRFDTLRRYERGDGPTPVPLYPNMVVWVETGRNGTEEVRNHVFESPLLLVGVPQGAVTGTIELTVQNRDGWSGTQDSPLFDLGEGLWLASMEAPWNPYSSNWCEGGAYTLRLYGGDGALLLEQTGTIPQAA